jgi:hypothetical protein
MAKRMNWDGIAKKTLTLKRGVSAIELGDATLPFKGRIIEKKRSIKDEEKAFSVSGSWFIEDVKIEKKIERLKSNLKQLEKEKIKFLKKQDNLHTSYLNQIKNLEKKIKNIDKLKKDKINDIDHYVDTLKKLQEKK